MLGKCTFQLSRFSRFAKALTFSLGHCRLVYRLFSSAALIVSFSIVICPQYRNTLTGKAAPHIEQKPPVSLIEFVPKQYSERYNRWKKELLSVEYGRRLWANYAENPAFRLIIVVSKKEHQGAKVDDYLWEKGKLVGVTVTLGYQLDSGFPSTIKYPVLGSLTAVRKESSSADNEVLAAAKFAHELGHVEHAALEGVSFQLQNQLAQTYVERFLSNGHNATDPLLEELAARMGGLPVEIKSEREIRAEVFALRYLLERLETKAERKLLKKVEKSLEPKYKYLFSSVIEDSEIANLTRGRNY